MALVTSSWNNFGETASHFDEGWSECANVLRERDQDNLMGMSGELDVSLVFSGIVSAVVAVFVSQSATSLQPDPAQLTVDILRTISQQIAHPNTTAVVDIPPAFQSATIDIVLNSLLNASLFCSLIASTIGLWVKQWLSEYILDEPTLPRSRVRVRVYRYNSLHTWNMRSIVAGISILLQLSVFLLFTGLVMLTYKSNTTLAWLLLGLNAIWWTATWFSAVFPTFSATSPFKSPLSRAIFDATHQLRRTYAPMFTPMTRCAVGLFPTMERRESWETVRQRTKLELEALSFANQELRGSKRLTAINECFQDVDDKALALKRIESILMERYEMAVGLETFESRGEHGLETDDEGVKQLMRIWCDIYRQVESHEGSDNVQRRFLIFDAVSRSQ